MAIEPSSETQSIISRNWQRVTEEVAAACEAVGRDPKQVKIVGVTKYVGPAFLEQLLAAGCRAIGENRPQSLWQKREWLETNSQFAEPMEWHLIGHLQRNKVRKTIPLVDLIQSVDSLRIASEISRESTSAGLTSRILLDVNVTQDATKTGFLPNQLRQDIESLVQLPNVSICGLMAMSSLNADEKTIRGEFRSVARLREELESRMANWLQLSELSMGMSGDYREAIAEGSTCVRIGSHLWSGIIS